jgi:putative tricarboxylic transport membrane protein
MLKLKKAMLLSVLPVISFAAGTTVQAADWAPKRPVSIVAVAGAGGGLDMVARTMAKVFDHNKIITQAITVENKPGGGQVTGTVDFATRQAKNEYAMMIASTPFILNHIKRDGNSPIGPDDIYPLALLQVDYGVIAVRADSSYKTLKELYDTVKANPASVQFVGGGGPGTWDHLNSMLLARDVGINIKTVKYNTYDGGGEALTALLGGHGDAMTSDVSSIKQYVQAGRVRVLGVSSEGRLADDEVAKDFPTYKEQGFNVLTSNWRGVFLGKSVSPAAKDFWGKKMGELVATEEWKDELKKQGVIYIYKDAKEFYDYIKADQEMYTQIYKEMGIAK